MRQWNYLQVQQKSTGLFSPRVALIGKISKTLMVRCKGSLAN